MNNSKEVFVNIEVLGKMVEISEVIDKLDQAYTKMKKISTHLSSSGGEASCYYMGDASEDISTFCSMYMVHIQTMKNFYKKALDYGVGAVSDLLLMDSEQAALLSTKIGGV